jgi:hypothetical protein
MKNTSVYRTMGLGLILLLGVSHSVGAVSFTNGNILVTQNDHLIEYTNTGAPVQSISVPYMGGRPATEHVRDVIVGPTGTARIYNGTFDPFMTSYDSNLGSFSSVTHTGWSTVNNVSYGGIATLADYVYVTDMRTFGDGGPDEAQGIVRFNTGNNTSERFAETLEFIDLSLGLDGYLYALEDDEYTLRIYNTTSMSLVNTVNLSDDVRGVAVSAAGSIFGASWDGNIYQFDSSGSFLGSIPSGANDLTDIDLAANGEIVVGSRFGDVILTDSALSTPSAFSVGSSPTFVSFTEPAHPVPEPKTLTLLASGLLAGFFFWRRKRSPL